jgi:hypothetical protein
MVDHGSKPLWGEIRDNKIGISTGKYFMKKVVAKIL